MNNQPKYSAISLIKFVCIHYTCEGQSESNASYLLSHTIYKYIVKITSCTPENIPGRVRKLMNCHLPELLPVTMVGFTAYSLRSSSFAVTFLLAAVPLPEALL
jgi:hypothetical protein